MKTKISAEKVNNKLKLNNSVNSSLKSTNIYLFDWDALQELFKLQVYQHKHKMYCVCLVFSFFFVFAAIKKQQTIKSVFFHFTVALFAFSSYGTKHIKLCLRCQRKKAKEKMKWKKIIVSVTNMQWIKLNVLIWRLHGINQSQFTIKMAQSLSNAIKNCVQNHFKIN